ncbi:MAG: ArsA-related P-loop ATPase [Actinomycetota bacterium]
MSDVLDAVSTASVVLCCGTGGVGKTTTSAALAVAAARAGRRAVVVTIDPARRLADALGLDGIGNDCARVATTDIAGDGELWVTMLDTKATFDALIERHAHSPDQAERILTNRYYRNLSTSLSGTREFMAMERLYELHHDDRFDLVIVDTPPTRNALDFLEAPDRLGRFLDGRLFRLAAPGRRMTRRLTAPIIVLMRRIARVISPEVVDDTLAFIEAFGGMEEGFRDRAKAVDALLADDTTAFVLVTAPLGEAIDESCYFAERLRESGLDVRAVVVNRLQPRFTDAAQEAVSAAAAAAAGTNAQAQLTLLADLVTLADAEEAQLAPLLESCPDAPVARIPQLDGDVHDLEGIEDIATCLSG